MSCSMPRQAASDRKAGCMVVQGAFNTRMPRHLRRRASALVSNFGVCICIQEELHHTIRTEKARVTQGCGAHVCCELEPSNRPVLHQRNVRTTEPFEQKEEAAGSARLVDVCLGHHEHGDKSSSRKRRKLEFGPPTSLRLVCSNHGNNYITLKALSLPLWLPCRGRLACWPSV